jgi:hypothetical protein
MMEKSKTQHCEDFAGKNWKWSGSALPNSISQKLSAGLSQGMLGNVDFQVPRKRLWDGEHPAGLYHMSESISMCSLVPQWSFFSSSNVMLCAEHISLDMACSGQKTLQCHLPGSARHLSIKAAYKYFSVFGNSLTGGSYYACGQLKPPDLFHVSCCQRRAL